MKTFNEYITESVASTPHKELRAAGWKKTGVDEHQSGTNHVYTHPHHTGHEIYVNPKNGAFEHKVNFSAAHKQKGKAAKGMSELAKHLDAHSRHTSYDANDRAAERRKHSHEDRSGARGFAGPRGFGG